MAESSALLDLQDAEARVRIREDMPDIARHERDDDNSTSNLIVKTCFLSRSLEMACDYLVFGASVVALSFAKAACREFQPPLYVWLAAACAFRFFDALNYTWLFYIKKRVDPRERKTLRFAAIVLRALTLLFGALLVLVMYSWDDQYFWMDGGVQKAVDADAEKVGNGETHQNNAVVCNSWLFEVATLANFYFSVVQTVLMGTYSLVHLLMLLLTRFAARRSAGAGSGAGVGGGGGGRGGEREEGRNRYGSRGRRLSETAWRSLTTIVTFDDLRDSRDEVECAICQVEFTPQCRLRALPCHHFFHVDCIDQWISPTPGETSRLTGEKSCPVCRAVLAK